VGVLTSREKASAALLFVNTALGLVVLYLSGALAVLQNARA
jgi:hypothetical protein